MTSKLALIKTPSIREISVKLRLSRFRLGWLSLMILALTNACGYSEPPIEVQFCVQNDSGVERLKEVLGEFSAENGFYFSDHGANMLEDLTHLAETTDTDPVSGGVYFSISDEDRVLLSASNLGLSYHQILLAAFVDTPEKFGPLMTKIESNWELKDVLPGDAALPDPECGSAENQP